MYVCERDRHIVRQNERERIYLRDPISLSSSKSHKKHEIMMSWKNDTIRQRNIHM